MLKKGLRPREREAGVGGVCRARSALHTPPNPLIWSHKQVLSELLSEAQIESRLSAEILKKPPFLGDSW